MELAEDWLAAKWVTGRTESVNSDRARRSDLCRWGRALHTSLGRRQDQTGQLDLAVDLAGVRLTDLTADNCLHALAVLRSTGMASSTARALSTWRGFCRWLTRRGHLTVDPTDDDLLTIATPAERFPHAFTSIDIQRLTAAAATPGPRVRSAWPARDVAIVELLAASGARTSELCAVQIGDLDRDHETPILRLRRATKSGAARDIPLPGPVVELVDTYLAEREKTGRRAPLLVRLDSVQMTRFDLDHLLRRLCSAGGVTAPPGEMAHGFRHHYGTELAVRAVPLPLIQQLLGHTDPRTTSIYTRVTATTLTTALHDAGMLTKRAGR